MRFISFVVRWFTVGVVRNYGIDIVYLLVYYIYYFVGYYYLFYGVIINVFNVVLYGMSVWFKINSEKKIKLIVFKDSKLLD